MYIEADKEAISVIDQVIEFGMRKGAFGVRDIQAIATLQATIQERRPVEDNDQK